MDYEEVVVNTSTALMYIKDLATYKNVPINIHFDNHYIHIIVGFGTPRQKKCSWYPQDCYRRFACDNDIYKWIEEACEEIAAYGRGINED